MELYRRSVFEIIVSFFNQYASERTLAVWLNLGFFRVTKTTTFFHDHVSKKLTARERLKKTAKIV